MIDWFGILGSALSKVLISIGERYVGKKWNQKQWTREYWNRVKHVTNKYHIELENLKDIVNDENLSKRLLEPFERIKNRVFIEDFIFNLEDLRSL